MDERSKFEEELRSQVREEIRQVCRRYLQREPPKKMVDELLELAISMY